MPHDFKRLEPDDNQMTSCDVLSTLLLAALACTSETDERPIEPCLDACAQAVAEDCNAALQLDVCEASCEQGDPEQVEAFTECVEDDVCGDCTTIWCENGCG